MILTCLILELTTGLIAKCTLSIPIMFGSGCHSLNALQSQTLVLKKNIFLKKTRHPHLTLVRTPDIQLSPVLRGGAASVHQVRAHSFSRAFPIFFSLTSLEQPHEAGRVCPTVFHEPQRTRTSVRVVFIVV